MPIAAKLSFQARYSVGKRRRGIKYLQRDSGKDMVPQAVKLFFKAQVFWRLLLLFVKGTE
jgi:hypothetical protein